MALRAAAAFCRRLPPSIDLRDVRQAAVLGLLRAARDFDPRHGVPFRPYAWLRIRGEIVDYLREMDWASRYDRAAWKARGAEVSMESLPDERLLPPGGEPRPDELCLAAELRRLLAAAIAALPKRARQAVELYYFKGLTLREAGRAMGVNESRVCQILKPALRELRRALPASVRPAA